MITAHERAQHIEGGPIVLYTCRDSQMCDLMYIKRRLDRKQLVLHITRSGYSVYFVNISQYHTLYSINQVSHSSKFKLRFTLQFSRHSNFILVL